MPSNNQDHFQLSDEEFEQQFAQQTIDPTLFSHEAHVRLTWIHIKKYGLERATENMQKQIFDFACFHNGEGKYHTTITVAAVQIIYHFMQQSKSITFVEFVSEFPKVVGNFQTLLLSLYSQQVLDSNQAKFEYVEPDLVHIIG